MISPRILHVYEDQLFWECPTMSACEWHPSGDLSFQGLKTKEEFVKIIRGVVWRRFPGDGSQWYEAWGEIVQLYSACNLTKREDKLVALAGIAKTLADRGRSQGGYLAGIFERTLPHGLLWHRAAG